MGHIHHIAQFRLACLKRTAIERMKELGGMTVRMKLEQQRDLVLCILDLVSKAQVSKLNIGFITERFDGLGGRAAHHTQRSTGLSLHIFSGVGQIVAKEVQLARNILDAIRQNRLLDFATGDFVLVRSVRGKNHYLIHARPIIH